MKRTVKIIRIGEERKGISQKTGTEWKVREVDLTWEDEGMNGEKFDQSVVAQISGDTNEEALQYHMKEGTKFDARIYFGLSAGSNGRSFNRIRVYLPDEVNRIPTL